MRAVAPILAISLLVPCAGVQAQGPPSLAQVLAQARQQESEVVPTVDFPLVISVPATTFHTGERSRVLAVPTVEPNSPAALLWAAGATDLRLRSDSPPTPAGATDRRFRSDSRPAPAPTRLSGAAKAAKIVGTIISLPFLAADGFPELQLGSGRGVRNAEHPRRFTEDLWKWPNEGMGASLAAQIGSGVLRIGVREEKGLEPIESANTPVILPTPTCRKAETNEGGDTTAGGRG